ncbi:MAG TPA: hypothetical protein DD434_12055, partial [Bacteroidales bacterium]|nr:hypothetical protein [Bacteroidales bacterium]
MLSSHVIRNSNEDSLYWMLQKVILLNNKEILFSFIASPTYPSIFEFTYTKLIKVDTMGNVLRTKNFNDSISVIDIGYLDNQVLYSFIHNSFTQERNKIYFLNRETLEIEDSIVGYSATNMKEINDSTLTFLGENGKEIHYMPYLILCPTFDYYIYNKNTKFTHPIARIYNYLYDNVFLFWNYFDGFGGTEKNKIDFINQDSIYSVFNLRELTLSSDRYIGFGIINYKQSGDTNFVYKIIYNDSTINFIALDEIKATRDGGAILLIGYNLKNCIVKFMPNGLTSILDIETKEKEIEDFNCANNINRDTKVNGRNLTNIGTFRVYIQNYLKNHPSVHKGMTTMVRQLASGENGLPLEIYCFTSDTRWVNYESIQADIFDHIFAVAPEFGLQILQKP